MRNFNHIAQLKESYIFELKELDSNNHSKLVEPSLNADSNNIIHLRNLITSNVINDNTFDLCTKTIHLTYESEITGSIMDTHIIGVDASGVICLDCNDYNNNELHRIKSINFENFNIDNIAYLLDTCIQWSLNLNK